MTDSFLHFHQSALDNQREDDAINDLKDGGIYPDPDNTVDTVEDEDDFPPEDYEPSDDEMMSSFGTKWHDYL